MKRDWYGFRKHFVSFLALWVIIPILIHLILAIPLSRFIILEVRYLNWSAAGIWITSAAMASFLETALRIRKINYETPSIDAILQSPISNLEMLIGLALRGVVFGFVQFIFSIIITCTLNHEYLGALSILMIIIQIMAVILFFSVLGYTNSLIYPSKVFLILSLSIE